jgi:BirA family transcriptional regulator, biotin operon repressor / biotin---[acetyl-CoA-carboxylase] ligase
LTAKKPFPPIIELETVDSTNNYAMALVHAGVAQHGTAVLAHHQTAGKGQRGKSWVMDKGKNLSFSAVLRPDFLKPIQGFHLLATVAVTVHQLLVLKIGEEACIKWPNDMYWRDRKTGGILIENVFRGNEWPWAVVGIGLNLNQTSFPSFLTKAASLKQITGKEYNANELAIEIQTALLQAIHNLKTNGFEQFYNLYNANLFKHHQKVKLRKETRVFETIIQSVNKQGQLVTGIDVEECFGFGEVEWVVE